MAAESIWLGMFQAEARSGDTASVKSTRDAISDRVASYAMSDEQGARENALDNRQGTAVNRGGYGYQKYPRFAGWSGTHFSSRCRGAQPKKVPRIVIINLKTAKEIGLTIPPNFLARADKVIK